MWAIIDIVCYGWKASKMFNFRWLWHINQIEFDWWHRLYWLWGQLLFAFYFHKKTSQEYLNHKISVAISHHFYISWPWLQVARQWPYVFITVTIHKLCVMARNQLLGVLLNTNKRDFCFIDVRMFTEPVDTNLFTLQSFLSEGLLWW